MQLAPEEIFSYDRQMYRQLDANLHGRNYDVHVSELDWSEAGQGSISLDSSCMLSLTYYKPDATWEGAYTSPSSSDFHTVGNLVFVPPRTTLHCRWDENRQQSVACIFDVDRISALNGFECDWTSIDLARTLDVQNPFLIASLKRLAEEAATPSFASELQADCTLVLLTLELRRHFLGLHKEEKPASGKLSSRQIRALNELLDSSAEVGPNLSSLAQACDVTARQLPNLIKRTYGITLRDYVANARFKKAKDYLFDHKLMIKQVAHLCGFKSAAAFSAAFHKQTGATPQEFREAIGRRLKLSH
ncbi:MAG: Transcriptional regulator, AraC family [Verrucomicrobiaceae bacterium]|nr:Transcriptional regulator, AraC family [Verrucomicrobiaceae bacterium]